MKNIINNGNTNLILLHPYIQKQGNQNRIWLIVLVSAFTLASLLTLVYTRDSFNIATTTTTAATTRIPSAISHHQPPLPKSVIKALIHYSANTNDTNHMSETDIKQITEILKQCIGCNFLVFGLTPETILWNALNHNGRTVFIDESRYYAAYIEEKHPEIEVYDVQYTTKIKELKELVNSVREQTKNECRPVQNLLFSDCKIGLNDLPNQLYEVEWDVILVDGPRGYWADGPGRMSAIFTAGVLARSKKGGNRKTHVFVHDYNREVERVSSEEFLCKENMVNKCCSNDDLLGHFVVDRVAEEGGKNQFCRNQTVTTVS